MKNKIIIALLLIAVIFLSGLISYILYQKNINICEPITLSFSEFEESDTVQISISAISPIGKEYPITYSNRTNKWKMHNGSYCKAIVLILNDSISNKLNTVIIDYDNKTFKLPISSLQIVAKSTHEKQYILPSSIRSQKSFFSKFIYVISSNTALILLVFLSFVAVAAIVSLVMKYRNGKLHKQVIYRWVKTLSISIIIALGIFYGYLLIKFTISSIITAMLFITIIGLILWLIIESVVVLFPKIAKFKLRIKKIILIFIIIWICVECTLRFFGVNKSYNEKMTNYYSSGFNDNLKTDSDNPHLFVLEKNTITYDVKDEFTYKISSNNDGLRDIDHSLNKSEDELRIICFGNSFTEGIGAPQDSTWPKLLEDNLNSIYDGKISVFNAGISGSDPFFSYMLLEERMLKYKPDIVLLALQETDFNFHRFRGGFERFTDNGYHYREPPSWEKLYAASYVFRLFLNNILGYPNKYLQSQEEYKKEIINANLDIENCVNRFYKLSTVENFKFVVVIIDFRLNSKYDLMASKLKKEDIITVIDLKDFNKNIKKLSDKELKSFFWKIDMHCNSKGYNFISNGIIWKFNEIGIIDSIKKSTKTSN
jgi:hypothetical protein